MAGGMVQTCELSSAFSLRFSSDLDQCLLLLHTQSSLVIDVAQVDGWVVGTRPPSILNRVAFGVALGLLSHCHLS